MNAEDEAYAEALEHFERRVMRDPALDGLDAALRTAIAGLFAIACMARGREVFDRVRLVRDDMGQTQPEDVRPSEEVRDDGAGV